MFGQKETFRKAALERLASPERLDEMMKVTSPKGWIALVTATTLLIVAGVWSIFGRIPDRVAGQGILIPGGSMLQIEAGTSGRITQVFVKEGDLMQAGDKVAGINLEGQKFDFQLLEDQLKDLERRDQILRSSEKADYDKENVSIEERIRGLQERRKSLQVALDTAKSAYERASSLFKQGAEAKANVERAQSAFATADSSLREVDGQIAQLAAERSSVQSRILTGQDAREREIGDVKRKMEKQQQEMRSTAMITSPFTARVAEVLVHEGMIISDKSTIVVRLERMDEELKALVYVPSRSGKKVEIKQVTHISPSTVKKEEYGSILGEVAEKMTQPATPKGMLKDLGNEKLVEEYSKAGAPLRILINLKKRAKDSVSGYEWTSGSGPQVKIYSGTPCTASIIVGQKRPIDYVIPIFRSLGIE